MFSTGALLQMRACGVVRGRAQHACDGVNRQMPHPLPTVIVASGCLYLGTEIANSTCSWCAGVEGQPWVPVGSTVGPLFLAGIRGSPQKIRQLWVPVALW